MLFALSLMASLGLALLLVRLTGLSSEAAAGRQDAELRRACGLIQDAYSFYSTGWSGPASTDDSAAFRHDLADVVKLAVQPLSGISGGVWQADTGVIAYVAPGNASLSPAGLEALESAGAAVLQDGLPASREGGDLRIETCGLGASRCHGDTVQICTADAEGNMVSLISSLYQGSGVVAGGTGIHFHNRASMFSIDGHHPNAMEPGRRPFHTLMPGFALLHDKPYMAFGVTGGHQQPQGQVQFLLNFLLHGMTLQEAVSAPRFECRTENVAALECDFPPDLRASLLAKGHVFVENDAGPFGGAQALRVLENGVFEGASDPRKDGCAIGY